MSPFYSLIGQNKQIGANALENSMQRSAQLRNQLTEQAFRAAEAEKQRKFQEDQRKKQESAQKKAMWTNLGINAGTSAAGGAIVGGLAAAEAPIAATAPGVAGGTIPVGDAATTLADTSMGLGMPATVEAAGPALANAPRNLAMSSVPTSGTPGATFASPIAKATYRPFAGGSVAGGAAMGGALGALGALGGQNYLGTALAMPGANYARSAALANDATNEAYRWTKLGMDSRENEDMRNYRDRQATTAEKRANRPSPFMELFSQLTPEQQGQFAQVKAGVAPNANTTAKIASTQDIAAANRAARDLEAANRLGEQARQFDERKPIWQQNANSQTSMANTRQQNASEGTDWGAMESEISSVESYGKDSPQMQATIEAQYRAIRNEKDKRAYREFLRSNGYPLPGQSRGSGNGFLAPSTR